MAPTPTLYRVAPGAKREELQVDKVWSQDGAAPLPADAKQIVSLTVGTQPYVLSVDAEGKGTLLRATAAAPFLEPVASKIDFGKAFDSYEPFTLGSAPYVLAYAKEKGELSFFPLSSDFATQPAYTFRRTRPPATSGFTVTQPVVINSLLYVLCYSFDTGEVDIFSLSVTATPQPGAASGTPPLLMLPVWIHTWARKWTRFAFFTMGAENFFFKTNVGKLNVNIDHILDDPSQGTVEVGTYLKLDDALDIDIVRSFAMNGGDPYFLTYMDNAKTTLNRFHADCQGWTQQAALDTVEKATQVVPWQLGEETFVLFY